MTALLQTPIQMMNLIKIMKLRANALENTPQKTDAKEFANTKERSMLGGHKFPFKNPFLAEVLLH